MKVHAVVASVLAGSLFVITAASAAEQKMLFNVESISYKKGTYDCQSTCSSKYDDPPLEKMLAEGWRIISSSPKEAIGSKYWYVPGKYNEPHGCTCIGTQYVLQKDDPPKPDVPSKNEELLKKETELLKQEIALLKQENKNLKEQLKPKQKKK